MQQILSAIKIVWLSTNGMEFSPNQEKYQLTHIPAKMTRYIILKHYELKIIYIIF